MVLFFNLLALGFALFALGCYIVGEVWLPWQRRRGQ